MNPRTNPFAPGAGSQPPELAGRSDILELATIAVDRTRSKLPANNIVICGLHGVGKTVLLHRIWQYGQRAGLNALLLEASDEKSFAELLIPALRQALFSLNAMGEASEAVKRAMRVLRSFANTTRHKLTAVDFAMDGEPGVADSGDLNADLSQLFQALGEAVAERETALLLCLDELQFLTEKELSALVLAMHHVSQRMLPVLLMGAGLPHYVALSERSRSYVQRLFVFFEIYPLPEADATLALVRPLEANGVPITPSAVEAILQETKGVPYFLQQWGHEAWNLAEMGEIDTLVVKKATESARAKLDGQFYSPIFEGLTPREKEYLRALAGLGEGVQRTGEIAAELNSKPQQLAPIRASLIRKGMLYSPAYGETAFAVPHFGEYLMRVMA